MTPDEIKKVRRELQEELGKYFDSRSKECRWQADENDMVHTDRVRYAILKDMEDEYANIALTIRVWR